MLAPSESATESRIRCFTSAGKRALGIVETAKPACQAAERAQVSDADAPPGPGQEPHEFGSRARVVATP